MLKIKFLIKHCIEGLPPLEQAAKLHQLMDWCERQRQLAIRKHESKDIPPIEIVEKETKDAEQSN